jgi:hypothetical protein
MAASGGAALPLFDKSIPSNEPPTRPLISTLAQVIRKQGALSLLKSTLAENKGEGGYPDDKQSALPPRPADG